MGTVKNIHRGHEYVDLGLSVKWATCNIGAARPSDSGYYYAWGETSPKREYNRSTSKTYRKDAGIIAGNPDYDAARFNWEGEWRLPSDEEFQELRYECQWQWTTIDGQEGCQVTGPNGNSIFLPASGYIIDGNCITGGEGDDYRWGAYWSATPDSFGDEDSMYLGFDEDHYDYDLPEDPEDEYYDDGEMVMARQRYYGLTIRPVLGNY